MVFLRCIVQHSNSVVSVDWMDPPAFLSLPSFHTNAIKPSGFSGDFPRNNCKPLSFSQRCRKSCPTCRGTMHEDIRWVTRAEPPGSGAPVPVSSARLPVAIPFSSPSKQISNVGPKTSISQLSSSVTYLSMTVTFCPALFIP